MNVYLLAGFPCSGKSTALRTAYESGLYTIEMSNIVKEQYKEETGKENANDNEIGRWATNQRLAISFGYFAEHAANLVNNRVDAGTDVAVSGVRSVEEVETFRSFLPDADITVIGIRCPESVRWKWAFEDRDMRPSEMRERDQRENEWGLDKLLNRETDMIIRNGNVTEERFKQKVKNIVNG